MISSRNIFGHLSLMMAACLCCATSAQEKTPVALVPQAEYKVATNPFSQNWEVSIGIQGLSFYSNQETGTDIPGGLFKDFRTQMGISAAVTKWFSPEVALRTKAAGCWGKSVSSDDKTLNAVKYMHLHEDVMLNLTNVICDYKERRTWDFIPYIGIGMTRNFTQNENAMAFNIGLLNSYRLSDRMKAYLEISFTILGDEFDNQIAQSKNFIKNHDRFLAAEIGLALELGQNKWKKVPDIDQIEVVPWEETNREMKKISRKVKDLQEQLDYMEETKSEIATSANNTPEVSIFFELGSSELKHRQQLENIKDIVSKVKAEKRNIVVTGYADSYTGNKNINDELSAKRAETVVKELLDMGVNIDNIKVVIGGGVNTFKHIPANRRVVLTLQ